MVAKAVMYDGCMMELAWLEGQEIDSKCCRKDEEGSALQVFGDVRMLRSKNLVKTKTRLQRRRERSFIDRPFH